MKSNEKKKVAEDSKLRYQEYLEEAKKRHEEVKKQARERDQKPIGEMRYGDLTHLVDTRIRAGATTGDLPILSVNQKKTLSRLAWISVGLIIVGFVVYQKYWRTTDYSLLIDKEHLYLRRTLDGESIKYEMIPKSNGWHICVVEGSCVKLLVPVEARYNNYYKFVFLVSGQVFWVKNDMTDQREVRFVDGSWSHENDDSDEPWTSFEIYDEMSDDGDSYR